MYKYIRARVSGIKLNVNEYISVAVDTATLFTFTYKWFDISTVTTLNFPFTK